MERMQDKYDVPPTYEPQKRLMIPTKPLITSEEAQNIAETMCMQY